MKQAELARRLRDIETDLEEAKNYLGQLRGEVEHEDSWQEALDKYFSPEPRSPYVADPEPETSFVEQVELTLENEIYHVHLRFTDDEREELGRFSLHSTAYDYAREQARRYKIAIFDSTYEDLVN